MVVQRVAVQTVAFKKGCDAIGSVNWAGEEQQCPIGASRRAQNMVGRSEIMGRRCVAEGVRRRR
eukprot:3910687-Pleurochrysis_carterae.AAC.1